MAFTISLERSSFIACFSTACDMQAIRNILSVNRTLVNAKMYGYEGTDVFEVIKNVRTTLVKCVLHY